MLFLRKLTKVLVIGCIAIFVVIFLGGVMSMKNHVKEAPDNHPTLYVAECRNSSISLKVDIQSNSIEGDLLSYGLNYVHKDGGEKYIYRVEPPKYYEVTRTGVDFEPLPKNTKDGLLVSSIELPNSADRVKWHDAERPPFMNIFLDPTVFSQKDYNEISDCLSSHKDDLNKSLLNLADSFPPRSRQYYHPLRLGGVVFGLPPYKDPSYVSLIRESKGVEQDDTTKVIKILENTNNFTLYPGQRAEGDKNGIHIVLYYPEGKRIMIQKTDGTFETMTYRNAPDVLIMREHKDGSVSINLVDRSTR
jgi:hypothetical protein